MGYHVAVARAVHLLGIDRHELQNLIRKGELHTFEGQIDMDELRRHFPMLALDEDNEYERLQMISQTAFARRVSDRVMPSKEDLSTQLKRARMERDVAKAKAKKYRQIIEDLAQVFCDLQETEDAAQRELVNMINRRLLEELEKTRML